MGVVGVIFRILVAGEVKVLGIGGVGSVGVG